MNFNEYISQVASFFFQMNFGIYVIICKTHLHTMHILLLRILTVAYSVQEYSRRSRETLAATSLRELYCINMPPHRVISGVCSKIARFALMQEWDYCPSWIFTRKTMKFCLMMMVKERILECWIIVKKECVEEKLQNFRSELICHEALKGVWILISSFCTMK